MKIKVGVKTLINAMEWWITQEEVNESPQNVRTVAEHFGLNKSTLWYAIRMNLKIISPRMYEQINSYISRNRRGEISTTDYEPKKFVENYVRTLNNQPVLKSTRTSKKAVLKTETEIVQNESSELPVQEHKCACKTSICEKKNQIEQAQKNLEKAVQELYKMSHDMLKQSEKFFMSQKHQNILHNRRSVIAMVISTIADTYNLLGDITE